MRNRQPGGVKGYADGKVEVPYEAGNRDSFMSYFGPYAEEAGNRLGVDKSIILAQLGHETGWGKSVVGNNNLGNIKDFSNREGSKQANDKIEKSNDNYRSYASPKEFFDDYSSLIEKNFPGAVGSGSDLNKFVGGLTGPDGRKYATDPKYLEKMRAIMSYNKGVPEENESAAETRRLAAHPVPPPPTDIRAQAEFANRWSQPVTVNGNPMVDEEIKTLKRYIENPSTPANERGKARLRLAELERKFNDQSTMPALGRNYSGTAKPAGSSAIPGQSVSTAPARFEENRIAAEAAPVVPAPSPKAPDGFSMIPKSPTKMPQPQKDDQSAAETARLARAGQMDSTLEDPTVKSELSKLQASPPPPGVEPKNWLAQGLAKIFGPTGVFNEEDLIRFSLLAAGGMLTGGSTGGSLRFAGLATLKSSDERRQAQAMAAAKQDEIIRKGQVEAAKDVRERNQTLENTYYQKMDKASPEAKAAAIKLFEESRAPGVTPAVREAKLAQALHVLSTNQVDTSKDGKPRAPVSGYNSKTGEELQYFWDDKNNMMVRDPKSGGFVDAAKAGIPVASASEFNKQEKDQRDSISKRLTSRLSAMNSRDGKPIDKSYTDAVAKTHAEGLTEEFMSLRRDMGYDMKPEDFSKVVDNAIADMQENYRGRKLNELTPEALRRIVYGSAVIAMRPTNKAMYEVEKADGKPGRPGEEALFNYGNAIQKAVQEGRRGGVELTPEKVSSHWESQFKALPDKIQKDYAVKARAVPSYSPFLLWVKDNTVNR